MLGHKQKLLGHVPGCAGAWLRHWFPQSSWAGEEWNLHPQWTTYDISRLPEVYRKPRLLEKRRITERKSKNTRLRMHWVSPSTCQATAFTLRFAPALPWRADLSNTVVGQGFFLAKFHVVRKDAADLSTTVYAVSVGGLKTRVLILERR